MAHIVHDCTIGGAAPSGVELLGSFNPLKETKKTDADRKKRKTNINQTNKLNISESRVLCSSRRYPRLLHESSSNYLWDKQWRAVFSVSIHVCTSSKFRYKNIVLEFAFVFYVKHLFRITCSTVTDTVLCRLFGFVTIWVRLQWNIANLDHHFITSWPP